MILFKNMPSSDRDKIVLDYIADAQPVTMRTIFARIYVPGLHDVPTERDIDLSPSASGAPGRSASTPSAACGRWRCGRDGRAGRRHLAKDGQDGAGMTVELCGDGVCIEIGDSAQCHVQGLNPDEMDALALELIRWAQVQRSIKAKR